MNLFGRKKPADEPVARSGGGKSDSSAAAIAKLRDTTETMDKRIEHLQRKVDAEVKQAITFNKANKKREALACIKRKKLYEKQVEQLENTSLTIQNQQINLEAMRLHQETLAAQRQAAQATQQLVDRMGGTEGVEDLQDKIEEGLQDAAEIQDAMSRDIGGGQHDEDDLTAELEGLMADDLADDMTQLDMGGDADAAVSMPSAPVSMPSAPTAKVLSSEEEELAALEASMAM